MAAISTDKTERYNRIKSHRMQRIVSSVILGGSVVVAGAILLTPEERPAPISAPITAAAPAPAKAQPEPQAAAPEAIEAEATKIDSQRIAVALPTEDTETDFAAEAQEEIDRGELGKAFISLRRHLYRHDPTAETLLELGRIGRQIDEHAIAEQALLDAAALDPTHAGVEIELARVLLEVNELEEARAHARQALRLEPDSAIAWNVAGRVALAQSAWPRAEQALRRAVELEPTNAMFHNNLGLMYIRTGRAEDATDSLETAVELFGEQVPYFVYNNLGLAHEMAKHLDEARAAYEESVVANPAYARGKVNLERVLGMIAAREEQQAFDTAQGADLSQEEKPAL